MFFYNIGPAFGLFDRTGRADLAADLPTNCADGYLVFPEVCSEDGQSRPLNPLISNYHRQLQEGIVPQCIITSYQDCVSLYAYGSALTAQDNYGFERHTGGPKDPPIFVEEEAKIVRLAFEQYATGRFSDIEIAEMLNQHGYKTRSGRRFSKDSISGILRNPFYSGKVVYNNKNEGVDEIYEGKHEALISPELWERCQTWRRDRRTLSRAIQKKFNIC